MHAHDDRCLCRLDISTDSVMDEYEPVITIVEAIIMIGVPDGRSHPSCRNEEPFPGTTDQTWASKRHRGNGFRCSSRLGGLDGRRIYYARRRHRAWIEGSRYTRTTTARWTHEPRQSGAAGKGKAQRLPSRQARPGVADHTTNASTITDRADRRRTTLWWATGGVSVRRGACPDSDVRMWPCVRDPDTGPPPVWRRRLAPHG